MENATRYEGKPFLRLLELYVMWSIDELDENQKHSVSLLTPKLQKTYGIEGEWYEIVASQMEFPAELPKRIKAIWEKNKQSFIANDIEVNPEDFAQQFVDNNFLST